MPDHKFEPFDRVLVRNGYNSCWIPTFFSYSRYTYYDVAGKNWQFCIPYTPETAHLLGTSDHYEPPHD